MALNVGELVASLKMNTTEFQSGLRRAQGALGELSGQMEKTGKSMTTKLTLPLLGVAAAAVKLADDFELEMSRIQGLVGATGDEVAAMSDDILELAGDVGKAPRELAEAMFAIQSAGIKGAAATEALTIAAKAATAGLGSTRDVALAAASAMNAYGQAELSATQATDILTATVKEGNLAAAELASSIGKVIPVSAAAGVGLDEVGAAIALITRNGANAAEATTQVRAMLLSLNAPTKRVQAVFEAAGISADGLRQVLAEDGLIAALRMVERAAKGDASVMRQLLGSSEALSGALTLLNGDAETVAAVFDSVATSAGITQDAFDVAANTSSVQFQMALQRMKAALIDLGAVLSPILTAATNAVGDFVSIISSMSGGEQRLLLVLGGIVALAGPVMIGIGKIGTAMTVMSTQAGTAAASAAALNLALAGVAAVAALGVFVFMDFKKRQRDFQEQVDHTNDVMIEFNDVGAVTAATVQKISDALPDATEGMDDLSEALGSTAKDVLLFEQMAAAGLTEAFITARSAGADFGQMLEMSQDQLAELDRELKSVATDGKSWEDALNELTPESREFASAIMEVVQAGDLTADQLVGMVDAVFAVERGLRAAREENEQTSRSFFESGDAYRVLTEQLGYSEAAADELFQQLTNLGRDTSYVDAAAVVVDLLQDQEFWTGLAAAQLADYGNTVEQEVVPEVEELTVKLGELYQGFVVLNELFFDAEDMIADLAEGIIDLADSFDRNTREGRDNIRTVDAFIRAVGQSASVVEESTGSADAAAAAAKEMALEYLATAAAVGANTDAIKDLLIQAGLLTQQDFEVDLLVRANAGDLEAVKQVIDGLRDKSITISIAAEVSGITKSKEALEGFVGGSIGMFGSGGPVPGASGQAVPIIAHGGEFVLSADVVDAIRQGGTTRGLDATGGGAADMAGTTIMNYGIINQGTSDGIATLRNSGDSNSVRVS